MVKAYVLIVTQPGATRRVAEQLAGVPAIAEIHEGNNAIVVPEG